MPPSTYPRVVICALCCGVALGAFVLATPEWNFDVVAYDGAARVWLGESPAQAHADVYRELRSTAPAKDAWAITSLSEYREGVAASVEQFMVQLPMYTVKPLYVGLIAAIVKVGGNGIAAGFWVSAVAYGFFAVLVLLAFTRVAPVPAAFAIGLILLLTPPFLEVGRLCTPDALSACIVFGGFYALVLMKRPRVGAFLLLLSITARPDNVIFCLAICAWWWRYRSPRYMAAFGGALSAMIYVASSRMTGAYPWAMVFTHTYLRRLTDVQSVRSDVTVVNYFGAFLPGLAGANVLYPSAALLFVLIFVLGLTHIRRSSDVAAIVGLEFAIWVAAVVHFFAHPMLADRYFMVHYTCMTVLTVRLMGSATEASFAPSSTRSRISGDGANRVRSENQFRTTFSLPAVESSSLSMMNRCPSRATSCWRS